VASPFALPPKQLTNPIEEENIQQPTFNAQHPAYAHEPLECFIDDFVYQRVAGAVHGPAPL